MEPYTRFVVTPWRNSQELIQVRRDLYRLNDDNVDRRQSAVNKVLAWRARKESLPLLLESTADFIDVILQDETGGLKHNTLRLLYATAISRFVTGYLDTQIDLTRDRPSWFPSGKSLQPPISLLEVRHCIVHRHMPSLAELKRAVQTALDWLWEWYWSQLEAAFKLPTSPSATDNGAGADTGVTDKLQTILRTYIKTRKSEIKTKRAPAVCTAVSTALSTYTLRFSPSATSQPPASTQSSLLRLLVDDKQILPADKKLGSSMNGAFLIWTPLLLTFSASTPSFFPLLLEKVLKEMNDPEGCSEAEKEGMREWAAYMLVSSEWQTTRGDQERAVREKVLGDCMTELGVQNLRLAEKVVDGMGKEGELWRAILDASRGEVGEEMMVLDKVNEVKERERGVEVRVEKIVEKRPVEAVDADASRKKSREEHVEIPEAVEEVGDAKEKIKGPLKVVGLWKPKPIGWLPEEWDEDA